MSNEQTYTPTIDTLIKSNLKVQAAKCEGGCPLKSEKIAIYPVRYAIHENPFLESLTDTKATLDLQEWNKFTQKPSKYVLSAKDNTFLQLSELKTRAYTLRQLRQGWLYVWTKEDDWAEYLITPPSKIGEVTTFQKTDINQAQDDRPATGAKESVLYFKPNQHVYMAYSPIQWTKRIVEHIKKTGDKKHMRLIELPALGQTLKAPNVDILKHIDQHVADIFETQADTTFVSSMVTNITTEKTKEGYQRKQTISIPKMELIAKVEDLDSSIYVALDDNLGIVDDLMFNLSYPMSATELYEESNKRRTNTAQIIISLTATNLEEFVPDSIIKQGKGQKYQYIKDLYNDILRIEKELYELKDVHTEVARRKRTAYHLSLIKNKAKFKNKWREFPKESISRENATTKQKEQYTYDQMLADFASAERLRRNLYFDQMMDHLTEREQHLEVYLKHTEQALDDLLVWLNKLPPEAIDILYDNQSIAQSGELLTLNSALADLIQKHPKGQKWCKEELTKNGTLYGMAAFNFDKGILKIFTEIGQRIAQIQKINENQSLGTEGDSLKFDETMKYIGASRINDAITVLTNDQIKASAFYQSLETSIRESYQAFSENMKKPYKDLYTRYLVRNMFNFSALDQTKIAVYAVVETVNASGTAKVVINTEINKDYIQWRKDTTTQLELRKTETTGLANLEEQQEKAPTRAQRNSYNEPIHNQRVAIENRDIKIRELDKKIPIPILIDEKDIPISMGREEYFYTQSGAKFLVEQQVIKKTNPVGYKQSFKDFIKNNKDSAIPVGMALWNIYRATYTLQDTANQKDIEFKDIVNNISYLGYAGNAVLTLWLGPVWGKFSDIEITLKAKMAAANRLLPKELQLAERTLITKVPLSQLNKYKGVTVRMGSEALESLAQKVLLKVGIVNGLLALASFAEAYTVWDDIINANSGTEQFWQTTKFISLFSSGVIASAWLGSLFATHVLGVTFTIGAALGPFVAIGLFVAGVVYMISQIAISYFKREGLALWVDNSIWGEVPAWGTDNSEDHQIDELKALHKVFMFPTLAIKQTITDATTMFTDGTTYLTTGYWLQFSFPPNLAFSKIGINVLLVKDKLGTDNSEYTPNEVAYLNRIGRNGFWSDPTTSADIILPQDAQIGKNTTQPNTNYQQKNSSRYVYNVWIPYDNIHDKDTWLSPTTYLSIELVYPYELASDVNLLDLVKPDNKPKKQITYAYYFEQQLFEERCKGYSRVPIPIEQVAVAKEPKTWINDPRYKAGIQRFNLTIGVPDGAKP